LKAEELKEFEAQVATAFANKLVTGPVHLSGGNERNLIEIFKEVNRNDWVFASYRQHYHALLHGVPKERLLKDILEGHSMGLQYPEYRFFSSAIVGGCLSISVGVADAIKRKEETNKVWCFVGDMASTTGAFHEAKQYAEGHDLPITFVVEHNGLSCNTPTDITWGNGKRGKLRLYKYERQWPHAGIKEWVRF
jgi:TPP-dependent pyruvate/acetoin dehydrogenase alpha subunit